MLPSSLASLCRHPLLLIALLAFDADQLHLLSDHCWRHMLLWLIFFIQILQLFHFLYSVVRALFSYLPFKLYLKHILILVVLLRFLHLQLLLLSSSQTLIL